MIMKSLYKNETNEIFVSEMMQYYFCVKSKDKQVYVYWFDGLIGKNRVVDKLIEYVQKHGSFYYDAEAISPQQRTTSLVRVLYGFYHGIDDAESVKELKPTISNKQPQTGLKDFEYFDGKVYDLRKSNIHSASYGTSYAGNSVICHTAGDIIICKDGERYYTAYHKELYNILRAVTCWDVSHGDLKAVHKNKDIPLSMIVWAFYHGMLDGADSPIEKIVRAFKDFKKADIVIDHTTEDKHNNHIWALAEMKKQTNTAFLNYRTRLAAPMHFYMVYDCERKQYRVDCGLTDYGYTRRYVFNSSDLTSVLECFNCVKGAARKLDLFTKKPSKTSALRYWGAPERAHDPANPIVGLLEKDADAFSTFHADDFNDFPKDLI